MHDMPLPTGPIEVRNIALSSAGLLFFATPSIEGEIAHIKLALANQIAESRLFAKNELAEINQLFNKYDALLSNMETLEENDFNNTSPDYLSRVRTLFQLSYILRRVPFYCDFVESNILSPIKRALEEIRTLCGCDLNDSNTWKLAHPYTKKICRQATQWELSKMQLLRLFDTVTDEMELFVFNYGTFDERTKATFSHELNQNESLNAWITPFLELSGSPNPQWEMALSKAMDTLSFIDSEKMFQERKGYV